MTRECNHWSEGIRQGCLYVFEVPPLSRLEKEDKISADVIWGENVKIKIKKGEDEGKIEVKPVKLMLRDQK
jgi:hypothetical protein